MKILSEAMRSSTVPGNTTHKGGFYWAGSYASGDYLVFGSDDGSTEGNYTNTSILYSVSTSTGMMSGQAYRTERRYPYIGSLIVADMYILQPKVVTFIG